MDIDSVIQQLDKKIVDLNYQPKVNIDDKKMQLLERIKNGEDISYSLNLDDLLSIDSSNNISFLEYVCRRRLFFPYKIREQILKNKGALYICAKNNYLKWINNFSNEDIFFEKVDGDIILLQFICDNKVELSFSILSDFKKRYEIIDYLIKCEIGYYSQISNEIVKILFTEQNGIFPIDKYIDNKKLFSEIIKKAPRDMLINYCKVNYKLGILVDAGEDILLTDYGNGKMVIDELFDRGFSPTFNGYDFTDKRSSKWKV